MSANDSQQGPIVITTKEFVPMLLENQRKPKLSDDLNADGHSLNGIENVECKTVNGWDMAAFVTKSLAEETKRADGEYARALHVHEVSEVMGLPELIQMEIAHSKPKDEYALKNHRHFTEDVDGVLLPQNGGLGVNAANHVGILKMEDGKTSTAKPGEDYATAEHTHSEFTEVVSMERGGLGTDISKLVGYVFLIGGKLEMVANPAEVHKADIEKLESDLRASILLSETVTQELIPQQFDPEIITTVSGETQIMIPKRCHGLAISEIFAKTPSGESMDVSLEKGGKAVAVGDRVSADDIVTVKAKIYCFVRLSFSS